MIFVLLTLPSVRYTQLVPKTTDRLLVCICNHPPWQAG